MTRERGRLSDRKQGDSPASKSNGNQGNAPAKQLGFELDEQRPYGSNGAWAPQGGQQPSLDDPADADGSVQPKPDASNYGRTDSTTNTP